MIPQIENNELHNKVANAVNVFERILVDAPDVDVGWARDTALLLSDIKNLKI